jgi:hypothetical protein
MFLSFIPSDNFLTEYKEVNSFPIVCNNSGYCLKGHIDIGGLAGINSLM